MSFTPLIHPHSYCRTGLRRSLDVLFERGDERSGSSPLDQIYVQAPTSAAGPVTYVIHQRVKFDKRTGWPSFNQPIEANMAPQADFKLIWPARNTTARVAVGIRAMYFKACPRAHANVLAAITRVARSFTLKENRSTARSSEDGKIRHWLPALHIGLSQHSRRRKSTLEKGRAARRWRVCRGCFWLHRI